jgi:poly(3-hydroxybutyrate) depolymerase
MLSKKAIAIVTPAAAAESPKLSMINRLVGRVPLARMFPLLLLWPEVVLAGAPPAIQPSTTFQHQSVALGRNVTFTVSATGDPPLAFQWRLAVTDLVGCTNRAIAITNAQPSDEGDYTVVVSNSYGALTSAPARLYVVPPATDMVKSNYTYGARLPYFYHLPAGYDPLRRYPLVIMMHGTPGDENTTPPFFASYPDTRVFASYNQQATDPVILVFPTRRAGDNNWTDSYLQQVSGLIDKLITDFSIDTNRVYIGGGSEGVHAAWDLVGIRPSFFASVWFAAGWSGAKPPGFIKDVPTWVWCASNDDAGQLGNARALVQALLSAGGKPIYTEYAGGGHYDGIFMGMRTPVVIDWILAQRRGSPCTNEPLLSITSPTSEPTFATGASLVSLAGSAEALGQPVTKVTWKNNSSGRTGQAQGTNAWMASNIPLLANRTNTLVMTATTTSWSAGYGGNTTFIGTLAVRYLPLMANLSLQGPDLILSWAGGVAPFDVERATELGTSHWTVVRTNATPPVALPRQSDAEFYRVVTH